MTLLSPGPVQARYATTAGGRPIQVSHAEYTSRPAFAPQYTKTTAQKARFHPHPQSPQRPQAVDCAAVIPLRAQSPGARVGHFTSVASAQTLSPWITAQEFQGQGSVIVQSNSTAHVSPGSIRAGPDSHQRTGSVFWWPGSIKANAASPRRADSSQLQLCMSPKPSTSNRGTYASPTATPPSTTRFASPEPKRQQSGPTRQQSGPIRQQSGPIRQQSGPTAQATSLSQLHSGSSDDVPHTPSRASKSSFQLVVANRQTSSPASCSNAALVSSVVVSSQSTQFANVRKTTSIPIPESAEVSPHASGMDTDRVALQHLASWSSSSPREFIVPPYQLECAPNCPTAVTPPPRRTQVCPSTTDQDGCLTPPAHSPARCQDDQSAGNGDSHEGSNIADIKNEACVEAQHLAA